ncbi:glycosyltransferase [Halobacillus sp. A5]|uniref:glycosyltransferase family 4 protein n=1 Tax=Halobacillus sp. A5 TaxID=2880263 RepID=UPI0020A6D07D|nr:glycosyltransferase family 4 protein [Halobacillus sp. A5]
MKVLHINSYYSVSGFYENLYNEQIKSGLNLDVFVPISSSQSRSSINLGQYTKVSVNHGKYDRILFHLKHYKIYKDILKKFEVQDYSVIHAHSLFSNGYVAMKLKREYGIPYVVAVRNTDVNTFFKYMLNLRKLGIKILRESDKIIFLSDSYKEQVIEKYVPNKFKEDIVEKTEVIPNGIDDFWFENKAVPKKKLNQRVVRLLYIGVINKNKNLNTTLKAINILQRKGWHVKFTIVGKIVDESIYKQFKDFPYVKYISPKPKEELIDIYRRNDIFIMPSITETFGLVYAEAMSQGLPIIYSKGQGFDKQFEEGEVGYHVESSNEKEIADRLCDIISEFEGLSDNCIRKSDKFNWNILANAYLGIYTDINSEYNF